VNNAACPSNNEARQLAKDGFHILWCEGVGKIEACIVKLGAEVHGYLLGMKIVFICFIGFNEFPHTWIFGGEGDGIKKFLDDRC